MSFPKTVKLVEVGARDGLQNEPSIIPTDIKIEFINKLSATGLSVIETTSFVSPQWVPQLADHAEVFQKIDKRPQVSYPVLVPNLKGFQHALQAGVTEIAVFTTPSERFCQQNINCSVAESLQRIAEITKAAQQNRITVRGYISCVVGCPYQGEILAESVADLAEKLIGLGCYEVSLGDTVGVGTPLQVKKMLKTVLQKVPVEKLAVHFHDTYGQALVNIYVALELGVNVIDSSVGGLGGCPYAKGATGNVATEEVLYMLNGMNITTHVDLSKLINAREFIWKYLAHKNYSKSFN